MATALPVAGSSLLEASSGFPLRPLVWQALPLLKEARRVDPPAVGRAATHASMMPAIWASGLRQVEVLDITNHEVEHVPVDGGSAFVRMPKEWVASVWGPSSGADNGAAVRGVDRRQSSAGIGLERLGRWDKARCQRRHVMQSLGSATLLGAGGIDARPHVSSGRSKFWVTDLRASGLRVRPPHSSRCTVPKE